MARRARRVARNARARTASNATFNPNEQLASVFLSHVTDFRTRLNLRLVSKAFLHAERQDASTPVDPRYANQFGEICAVAGRLEDAFKWFTKASEQGQGRNHPGIAFNMGVCWFHGQGVEANNAEAVPWFTRAAEAGRTKAMVYLAALHGEGPPGVEKDSALSISWLKRAGARGDDPMALSMLAVAYLMGDGFEQDVALGVRYMTEAADQGLPEAQFKLGLMYKDVLFGVEQDIETGLGWLEKAAEGSHAEAQYELGQHYRRAREFEKCASYMEKAKDALPAAKFALASLYATGMGVDVNLETALDLTLEAGECGF